MSKRKRLANIELFLLLKLFINVHGENHWLMTEDGRIEAVQESLLSMAQPHNLVQFLRQDDQIQQLAQFEEKISMQKATITKYEEKDDPEIEAKLRLNDADCVTATKPLDEMDLFVSTVVPFSLTGLLSPTQRGLEDGLKPEEEEENLIDIIFRLDHYLSFEVVAESGFVVPRCAKYTSLPYSMAAFEHLDSMHRRMRLKMPGDEALLKAFLEGSGVTALDVDNFGHIVAVALEKQPPSWVLYNLATIYFRAKGNALEAIECSRRALHFSPSNYAYVAMHNLGMIQHASNFSEDAAVVLETALAFNDTTPVLYYSAAQACAIALQFNRSAELLGQLLELEPFYPLAYTLRAAVICHMKLERAYELQHSNLQSTLSELHSFQTTMVDYDKLQLGIQAHAESPAERRRITLRYDHFAGVPINGRKCEWNGPVKLRYLHCETDNDEAYLDARQIYQADKERVAANQHATDSDQAKHADNWNLDEGTLVDGQQPSVRRVLKPLAGAFDYLDSDADFGLLDASSEEQDDTGSSMLANSSLQQQTEAGDSTANFVQLLEAYRNLPSLMRPTQEHKFGVVDQRSKLAKDWPNAEDCSDAALPKDADVENIFVPPEHKGFEVRKLMNEYLNLNPSMEHPLPWYPPFCHQFVSELTGSGPFHLSCCDHLLGVQRVKKERQKMKAETQLVEILLDIAMSPSDSVSEVGQRIHTLLSFNIGPRWLLLNVAALYWRAMGDASEAVACLRYSLQDLASGVALGLGPGVSAGWPDLPLVQLAWLVYRAGDRLDDALVLARQATEVDEREPVSHFLMGWFLALKGNWTGAEIYAIHAVKLNSDYEVAMDLLKAIQCKRRYPGSLDPTGVKIERPPLADCDNGPRYFCVKEEGQEHCYLEERMVPGSAAPPAPLCPTCTVPNCIRPPPLASFLLPFFAKKPPSLSDLDSDPLEASPTPRSAAARNRKTAKVVERKHSRLYPQEPAEEVDLELSLVDESYDPSPSATKQAPSPSTQTDDVMESLPPPDQDPEDDPPCKSAETSAEAQQKQREIVLAQSRLAKPSGSKLTVIPPEVKLSALLDDELPEVLPNPEPWMVRKGIDLFSPPSSTVECTFWKGKIKLDQPTSTWLSISAKSISLAPHVDFHEDIKDMLSEKPICPTGGVGSMWTMDHLRASQLTDHPDYKPEKGLRDAFESLSSGLKESVEELSTRLALAMRPWIRSKKLPPPSNANDGSQVSWIVTTVAALYWRIKGNSTMTIQCLKHSLHFAPNNMKDLALVSLANVYHQAGFPHSALVAAGAALQISPKFVVVHFTLANIYAGMGNYDQAALFYFSTLALQNTFEPAKDRLRAIYCLNGRLPEMPPEGFQD